MGQNVRVLLVAMLVIMFSTGCNKEKRPITYSLPVDWPIQQLTLPPGSSIEIEPKSLHGDDPDAINKAWRVCFNNSDYDYQATVAHLESCLKPLGYQELWFEDPGTDYDSRLGICRYYSPDKLVQVSVCMGMISMSVNEDLSFETEFESDFILDVSASPVPDRILELAGTNSPNGTITHLEPIK